jgi:hypothetical protein
MLTFRAMNLENQDKTDKSPNLIFEKKIDSMEKASLTEQKIGLKIGTKSSRVTN